MKRPMGRDDQIVMCGFDVVHSQGIWDRNQRRWHREAANFFNPITAQAMVGRRCNRVGTPNAILAYVKCHRCFARVCATS
jgi:hypothetical protein